MKHRPEKNQATDPTQRRAVTSGRRAPPTMTTGDTITYLRTGRHKRASGKVVDLGPKQTVKVKPDHLDWKHVWLTPEEIAAGQEKPPIQPRKKLAEAPDDLKPKRERKPKAPPIPRWKQLIELVKIAETYGDQFIPIATARELADQLEASQSLFQSKP